MRFAYRWTSICDTDRTALVRRERGLRPVEWVVSDGLVPYPEAVAAMEARAAAIAAGRAPEQVWLLEHPPLYTAGTSAREADLISPDRFPVFRTGRGGEFTYHGPGQRVAYLMLDLNKRGPDLRRYVASARSLDHRDARPLQRRRRAARGPDRRLGAAARESRRSPTAARPRTRSPRSASASAAG